MIEGSELIGKFIFVIILICLNILFDLLRIVGLIKNYGIKLVSI